MLDEIVLEQIRFTVDLELMNDVLLYPERLLLANLGEEVVDYLEPLNNENIPIEKQCQRLKGSIIMLNRSLGYSPEEDKSTERRRRLLIKLKDKFHSRFCE